MADKKTGFRFLFNVEKTKDKGLGVFAGEKISKGSIVWRHVSGVFAVFDEHSFRARIERMSPAEVIYELTHVHAIEDFPGCLIRALDDGILINHSNDPSLVTNNLAPTRTLFDINSRQYLRNVSEALVDDRYSLVAIRNIDVGEELTNDYSLEDECPPFYDVLYEQYGVREDFLDDC